MDEVIVIGYGVEKKVNLTGAITNVKTEELSTISTTNLSNTLAGRAPGLTIVGSSGFMGASSEIRMRGGFGDPLFVIDGIIRDKAAFDALEPNEIDQLSFLKDAATASVYGSKAGNGVVLVTTKSGADAMGKPKFEYQGSYTFNRPTRKLFSDEMSAYKELVYQNLVAEANGLPLPNNEEEMEYAKTHDYNVNDLIWQNPWNTKHSISATGGTEKVKYYVLGNFIREEGSYKNLENNKYSFRSNLTVNLSKYISLNANISGYQKDDRRFNWPGSGDDSEDIFDFYRTTFNCLRTVPSYAYLDGTPANEKTDYPIYPDVSNFKGWNVADVVLGDRYIKTRRRNVNGILSLNIDLGKKWILMTYHPVTKESREKNLFDVNSLLHVLQSLGDDYEILVSKSNTDLYGSDINQLLNDYVCNKPCFHLFTSLGQKCYVSLLPQLYCMIGNSSSGVYETGYWKLPTINIGHRQEGRYMTSNIICCDNCSESIIQSLKKIETDEFQQMLKYINNPYGDGNASKRIVEQIKMYFNAVK